MCSGSDNATFGNPSYGPIFGPDEFTIASDSNNNQKSWADFGESYQHEDYQHNTEKSQEYFSRILQFPDS